MKLALRALAAAVVMAVAFVPSVGQAADEYGPGYHECVQQASYSFAYCTAHCPPYIYSECSRDFDWTMNACATQFPIIPGGD